MRYFLLFLGLLVGTENYILFGMEKENKKLQSRDSQKCKQIFRHPVLTKDLKSACLFSLAQNQKELKYYLTLGIAHPQPLQKKTIFFPRVYMSDQATFAKEFSFLLFDTNLFIEQLKSSKINTNNAVSYEPMDKD